jgi:hypothetical protein
MIRHIFELDRQAQEYAAMELATVNTGGVAEFNRLYRNKFAELIVKECMTMSDELKAQYLTARKSTMEFDEKNIYAEGEAACDVLKYKMKKHFGLE